MAATRRRQSFSYDATQLQNQTLSSDSDEDHESEEYRKLRADIIYHRNLIEEKNVLVEQEAKLSMQEDQNNREAFKEAEAQAFALQEKLRAVGREGQEARGQVLCLQFAIFTSRMLSRDRETQAQVASKEMEALEDSVAEALDRMIMQEEELLAKEKDELAKLRAEVEEEAEIKKLRAEASRLQRAVEDVRKRGTTGSTASTSAGTTPRIPPSEPSHPAPSGASVVASACASSCTSANESPASTPRVPAHGSLDGNASVDVAPSAASVPAGKAKAPLQKALPVSKGKGKGGHAKGGPPPPSNSSKPPPAKPPPAKAKSASTGSALPRSNGLVNVQWKESVKPQASAFDVESDPVLSPFLEFLDPESAAEEKLKAFNSTTIFENERDTACPGAQFPLAFLQEWFGEKKKISSTAAKSGTSAEGGGAGGSGGNTNGARTLDAGTAALEKQCLLDSKVVDRATRQVQLFKLKHSRKQDFDVALAIRNAVLTCSSAYDMLDGFQKILAAHREAGSKVSAFVQMHGEDALSRCEPEDEHRVVYALCSIPEVEKRMECLIFETVFPEASRKVRQDLDVLHDGMKVLVSKQEALRSLFQIALNLGNALNDGSNAPVATRGFRLATLPQLWQFKSPAKPEATLLHVALSLLHPADVKKIGEKVAVLADARNRKCSGVYQQCQELLSDLRKTEKQTSSIPKQRRRKVLSAAAQAGAQSHRQQTNAHTRLSLGSREPEKPSQSRFARLSLNSWIAPSPTHRSGEPQQEPQHRRRSPGPTKGPSFQADHNSSGDTVSSEEDDPSDQFHTRMHEFLQQSRNSAIHIAQLCQDVFETYWNLAVYFEDPWAVYPPPKQSGDPTSDIFAVFHDLAEAVSKASKDLGKLGLREDIAEAELQLAAPPKPPTDVAEKPPQKPSTPADVAILPVRAPSPISATVVISEEPSRVSVLPSRDENTSIPTSRGPSPSPAKQVATSVMALQRLRTVKAANASERSNSAIRSTKKVQSDNDDDDGEQSDVSNWSESPRKEKAVPSSTVEASAPDTAIHSSTPNVRPGVMAFSRRSADGSPAASASTLVSWPSSACAARAAVPAGVPDGEASLASGPPSRRPQSRDGRQPSQRGSCSPSFSRASASPNLAVAMSPCASSSQVVSVAPFFNSPCGAPSLAMSPKSGPPQRLPSSGGKRQERNRKSIAMVADRVCSAVVSKLLGGDEDELSGNSESDGPLPATASSPERRRKAKMHGRRSVAAASSTDLRGAAHPSGGKPPRRSLPLKQELEKEIRRRSFSRDRGPQGPTTPKLKPSGKKDLTPVQEPGETPVSDKSDIAEPEIASGAGNNQPATPVELIDPHSQFRELCGVGLRPDAFGPRTLNF